MLLHADDFKGYTAAANLLNGVYAASSARLAADPDPNAAAGSMAILNGIATTENWRWAMPATNDTVGVAFRIWMPNLPSTEGSSPLPVALRTVANGAICSLRVETNGQLQILKADGTQVAQSVGPVITANGWWHIEMKVTRNGAASSCEVRVEGVTVIDEVATLDFGATTIAQVSSRNSSGTTTTFYVKDLVVWDGSGTANNDFLGSVIVYELLPTADVSFPTGWTSTAANGWSVLDNEPPLDATAYISADNTPPAEAVFELSDLPADVSSIKGIITRVRMGKVDGGDGQVQVSLRNGGSDDDGTDRAITTTKTYWSDVSELDPLTGSAWTPGAADDARLVITRTV